MLIIGVDLGKTWVRAEAFVACDNSGDGLRLGAGTGVVRMRTPADSTHSIVQACIAAIRESERSTKESLAAVGVGSFGIIDSGKGTVIKSGTLPFWNDVPLAQDLEHALGVPTFIVNDVAADAIGIGLEYSNGDETSFAVVKLGSSVGVGAGGGHLTGLTLRRDFGQVSRLRSQSGEELTRALGGLVLDRRACELLGPEATAVTLFETANTGDEAALTAVERWTDDLVYLLSYVTTLLAPDEIYLSGGLTQGLGVLEDVIARKYRDATANLSESPPIIFALREDLARRGAASLAASRVICST